MSIGAQPGRRLTDAPKRRANILAVMRSEPARAWSSSDIYMHGSLWREMTRSQLVTAMQALRRDGFVVLHSKGSRETPSTWALTEEGRKP